MSVYPEGAEVLRSATISEDGQYRFTLERRWGPGPTANFVMLNPSTADGLVDDATIRKCVGFARRWGCESIVVRNLYALRATKPAELWIHPSPVGGHRNRRELRNLFDRARAGGFPVVAAWGGHADTVRVRQVLNLSAGVKWVCLGTTQSGQPCHPLMLPYATARRPFTLDESIWGRGRVAP